MYATLIKTDHKYREPLYWWDLTDKEREWFDYFDSECEAEGRQFIRYKGTVYDLGDVMRAEGNLALLGFDGFNSDSFFSGVAFRWNEDFSAVQLATVMSVNNFPPDPRYWWR